MIIRTPETCGEIPSALNDVRSAVKVPLKAHPKITGRRCAGMGTPVKAATKEFIRGK
jgi:hypothetical protein